MFMTKHKQRVVISIRPIDIMLCISSFFGMNLSYHILVIRLNVWKQANLDMKNRSNQSKKLIDKRASEVNNRYYLSLF